MKLLYTITKKKTAGFLIILFITLFSQQINAQKEVAYVQRLGYTLGAGASTITDDPIIRMLNADTNFNVTVIEADFDGFGTDNQEINLSGYDLIIAQETFGSGWNIFKPGFALALRSLPAPIIYNKSYALRNGRALSSTPDAVITEVPALSVTVDPSNQANPIFNGVTYVGNTIELFNETAADNGEVGTRSINLLNDLAISAPGTLLATDPAITDVNKGILINDIPAGTQLGDDALDTLPVRMISFAFNYGAIARGDGTNITANMLQLWKNAAYELTGLNNPKKEIAYVQRLGYTLGAGASTITDDPIIRMFNNDPDYNITVIEADFDGFGTDNQEINLSGYDLIIAQETFGSGWNIFKPGFPLALRSLPAPIIYNKSYALRNGRALSSTPDAVITEVPALSVTVDPSNQANPLFNGVTYVGNTIELFNETAADNGEVGTRSINLLNDLAISALGTLLATDPAITDVNKGILINDIPAGTQLGDDALDTLPVRMISFAFNYGAIARGDGTNITANMLQLWKNAADVLTGSTLGTTDNFSLNEISYYPNPTMSTASLKIGGESEKTSLSLFNITGKKVWSKKLTTGNNQITPIDLSDLSLGIYLLTIEKGSASGTIKIVKQ